MPFLWVFGRFYDGSYARTADGPPPEGDRGPARPTRGSGSQPACLLGCCAVRVSCLWDCRLPVRWSPMFAAPFAVSLRATRTEAVARMGGVADFAAPSHGFSDLDEVGRPPR